MKDVTDILGFIFITEVFFWGIIFVLFGQITVRRLRKNPATRAHLGIVWESGGDIYSTAIALTFHKFFIRRRKHARYPSLLPDTELILAHTTRLDRFLAIAFVFLSYTATAILFSCIALDQFGVP